MNYVTIDDAMRDWLDGIAEPLEFRDANGKVLGRYTPVLSPEEATAYTRARALINTEELDRRARDAEQGEGRTIEQVMERLKSLESAHEVHSPPDQGSRG